MILTRDEILKAVEISTTLNDGEIQEFAESTARAANAMASLALSRFREPVLELPEIIPVFSELNDKLDRIEILITEDRGDRQSKIKTEQDNTNPHNQTSLKLNKSGRPRDPVLNDIAEKIKSGNLSYLDGYQYYLEKYNITSDKNARDTFKAAMKLRGAI